MAYLYLPSSSPDGGCGESKVFMSTRDTVIRAYMAGAILACGGIRVTITCRPACRSSAPSCSRSASACSTCFGFDLLRRVRRLPSPGSMAPRVTIEGVLRNVGAGLCRNLGALHVAVMMSIVSPSDSLRAGQGRRALANRLGRTLGYEEHGAAAC